MERLRLLAPLREGQTESRVVIGTRVQSLAQSLRSLQIMRRRVQRGKFLFACRHPGIIPTTDASPNQPIQRQPQASARLTCRPACHRHKEFHRNRVHACAPTREQLGALIVSDAEPYGRTVENKRAEDMVREVKAWSARSSLHSSSLSVR
ncbi:hypothetical protein AB0F42_02495 [Streptomyces buecherae]|uniref:hypothetical protein n=1 Tax=Streptomyces buecherae TaxID=2763006 RepID=UPI0033E181F8